MKIPPHLKPGDHIKIISPSGKIESQYLSGAEQLLKNWGLQVEWGQHCGSQSGRFAGTKEDRLSDLREAWIDDRIKAILCSRGGYGAIQLLSHFDDSLIASHPKWLIGYSDITLLLSACNHAGIAAIHAPMTRHLAENEANDPATEYLRKILFGHPVTYQTEIHFLNHTGYAEGQVIGGNLSVLCALRGTSYDLKSPGNILFLEDIGEKPYQIERMFYNLKLGGILAQLSGLIIGQFTEYEEDKSMGRTVYEMISDLTQEYDYPICFNFPVGHVTNNYPMIVGANAEMSVTKEGVKLEFKLK